MTCVICNRGTRAVGYLCDPCWHRLDRTLAAVETEAAMLSAVPSMAQAHGARGGTLASHRSPARLDTLVLTDPRTSASEDGSLGILAVLNSWTRAVREDRQLAQPVRTVRNRIGPAGPAHDDCPHSSCEAMRVTVLEPATITGERRFLAAHLEWIAGQPFVDVFAAELGELLRQLQRANGTSPDRPIGRCYLPRDGGTCGGPIWVDDANGHAHCGTCRATWDGVQLAALKWEMDRQETERTRPTTDDGRPMYTVQEIAARLGCTVNAAYIRLSRAGIRAGSGHFDLDALTTSGRVAS